ncbi:hypothetical protein [Rhizobium sp. NPDC090279]|uniref:hypothetical protein n=1 Tax=Rhizobium sp. NPDC090279 TaxID=3364499 RepID=UPI00383AA8B9
MTSPAVDQICQSIFHRRVVNLKGELPEGYAYGAQASVQGITPVLSEDIVNRVGLESGRALVEAAKGITDFLIRLLATKDEGEKLAIARRSGGQFILDGNHLRSALDQLGMCGPFDR